MKRLWKLTITVKRMPETNFYKWGKLAVFHGKKFHGERAAEAQKGLDFLPVYGMMKTEN